MFRIKISATLPRIWVASIMWFTLCPLYNTRGADTIKGEFIKTNINGAMNIIDLRNRSKKGKKVIARDFDQHAIRLKIFMVRLNYFQGNVNFFFQEILWLRIAPALVFCSYLNGNVMLESREIGYFPYFGREARRRNTRTHLPHTALTGHKNVRFMIQSWNGCRNGRTAALKTQSEVKFTLRKSLLCMFTDIATKQFAPNAVIMRLGIRPGEKFRWTNEVSRGMAQPQPYEQIIDTHFQRNEWVSRPKTDWHWEKNLREDFCYSNWYRSCWLDVTRAHTPKDLVAQLSWI
jgi:hypothetical protein